MTGRKKESLKQEKGVIGIEADGHTKEKHFDMGKCRRKSVNKESIVKELDC